MDRNKHLRNKRTLVVTCGWALILTQSLAHAVTQENRDKRPRINLFPTSVVESLSDSESSPCCRFPRTPELEHSAKRS